MDVLLPCASFLCSLGKAKMLVDCAIFRLPSGTAERTSNRKKNKGSGSFLSRLSLLLLRRCDTPGLMMNRSLVFHSTAICLAIKDTKTDYRLNSCRSLLPVSALLSWYVDARRIWVTRIQYVFAPRLLRTRLASPECVASFHAQVTLLWRTVGIFINAEYIRCALVLFDRLALPSLRPSPHCSMTHGRTILHLCECRNVYNDTAMLTCDEASSSLVLVRR